MQQTAVPVEEIKVKKADVWKVPFSQIEIEPDNNIRKEANYGDIPELAESIRENGVLVAMRGYRKGDKFIPTDGHRRSAACQLLLDEGIDIIIPFIIEAKGTNLEQRVIDMFITNSGKQLEPLDMAEGIRRLINYGWKEKQIAVKLGKSEGYVRKLNSLNSAPKKFINLIESGVISSTFAISLISDDKLDGFMQDYEAGKYQPNKSEENTIEEGTGFFEHDEDKLPGKSATKITKKNVQSVNSIKEFKKLAKAMDTEHFTEEQTLLFNVISKVIDNEMSGEDLLELFTAA